MSTFAGYGLIGAPQAVRFAHYDADGTLIGEIAHQDGHFAEPVEVAAGQMLAVLTAMDPRLTIVHRES